MYADEQLEITISKVDLTFPNLIKENVSRLAVRINSIYSRVWI